MLSPVDFEAQQNTKASSNLVAMHTYKRRTKIMVINFICGRPSLIKYFFLSLSFVILLLSFSWNFFSVVDSHWFNQHQRDSESLVVGRLLPMTGKESLFDGNTLRKLRVLPRIAAIEGTYRAFLVDQQAISEEKFANYTGQFGLQADVLNLINWIMRSVGLPADFRLNTLNLLVAASLAATLTYILYLLKLEFGIVGSVSAFFAIFFSPWLIVFARNLYWVPFTWFLPIALTWRAYVSFTPPTGRNLFFVSTGIGLLSLIKLLCGFEYVTAIFGTIATVALYGLIRSGASFREIVTHGIALATAVTTALILAAFFQVLKIASTLGSFTNAWDNFIHRVIMRSHGTPTSQTKTNVSTSLNSSITDVLEKYWNDDVVIQAGTLISFNASQIVQLMIIFIATSTIYLFIKSTKNNTNKKDLLLIVFLASGALISSISWLVFAKGHSFVHTHMNYVLWHLPFLIIAPPICIQLVALNISRSKTALPMFIILAISLVTVQTMRLIGHPKIQPIITTVKIHGNEISITPDGILFELDCSKIVKNHRFFVHVGSNTNFSPTKLSKGGFLNMDFDWSQRKFFNLGQRCRAFSPSPQGISLDKVPITYLKFGQYRSSGDKSRIWTDSIGQTDIFRTIKQKIEIVDFSDHQWTRGIHNTKSGFFIRNTLTNRQSIAAIDCFRIVNEELLIKKANISNKWITIFLDKLGPLDFNMERSVRLGCD